MPCTSALVSVQCTSTARAHDQKLQCAIYPFTRDTLLAVCERPKAIVVQAAALAHVDDIQLVADALYQVRNLEIEPLHMS